MSYFDRIISIKLTPTRLIFLVPALLVLMANWTFFSKVEEAYPWAEGNIGFLVSLVFFHYSLLALLMVIFSLFMSARIAASVFILLAAIVGYFTDQLGVMINTDMIGTMFETNIAEATDLLNAGFIWHVLFRGLAPVMLMWLLPFQKSGVLRELRFKALAAVAAIAVMVLSILPLGGHYASFFREHKPLRNYMYPTASILYLGQYIKQEIQAAKSHNFTNLPGKLARLDVDKHPELIIMVVGETARADHFSLNGYARQTNPKLEMEKISLVIAIFHPAAL
jgi:lipid A ethanolaminephosphotransferase